MLDLNKVDTRFWVTVEAEEEAEDRSFIAGSYITKSGKQFSNLPEETRNLLYDLLWDNYQLPGIMEMSIEEVLALEEKKPT